MKRQLLLACTAFLMCSQLQANDTRMDLGKKETDQEAYLDLQALQQQFEKRIEDDQVEEKGVYTTSHPGAFQQIQIVSFDGTFIELSDGSQWEVSVADSHKVVSWIGCDLFITLNHSWFSLYDYCLVNLNNGEKAKVNITAGPFFQGARSHWIVAINYAARQVTLEDGSVWRIPPSSAGVLKYWMVNDPVIIGVYDGWFSASNPNFLMNVSLNKINQPAYIYGRCLVY
jgi:hypothetical protein